MPAFKTRRYSPSVERTSSFGHASHDQAWWCRAHEQTNKRKRKTKQAVHHCRHQSRKDTCAFMNGCVADLAIGLFARTHAHTRWRARCSRARARCLQEHGRPQCCALQRRLPAVRQRPGGSASRHRPPLQPRPEPGLDQGACLCEATVE